MASSVHRLPSLDTPRAHGNAVVSAAAPSARRTKVSDLQVVAGVDETVRRFQIPAAASRQRKSLSPSRHNIQAAGSKKGDREDTRLCITARGLREWR